MTDNTVNLADRTKEEIRERYEQLVGKLSETPYQEDTPAREYFRLRKFQEALKLGSFSKGGHLLEIGCNIGITTFQLASRGYQMHGIDLNPAAITIAQQRVRELQLQNISFSIADVEEMKLFPDNHFDGALSFSTLRYAPNLTGALSEIHRILKPGSRVVVDFPNRFCPWFYFKQWLGSEKHPHDNWFTKKLLKKLFYKCGFSKLQLETILFTPTTAPNKMLKLFQFADKACERLPLIKNLGGIIMVSAYKT